METVREMSTLLNFYLKMEPGETEEEAKERMYRLLEELADRTDSAYNVHEMEYQEV